MVFDFKVLHKSYVILVKAGPDIDTAKDYFSQIGETTVSNKVAVIDNGNITNDINASADTKIKSEVLLKTIEEKKEDQEYLRWQVDYRPYGITYPDVYIKDKLPLGLDLRLDSKGDLVIKDEYGINISVHELTLKSDGTYAEGQELALPDKDILSYENEARKLKFIPPDSSKSYRIRYLTDITGEGGLTINNEVVLNIGNQVTSDIGQDYTISKMDYGALFQRSGRFQIKKTDGDTGAFVKDAKFALCSLDGVVIREGITNADGDLYMKALPMGDFILKETEAPAGYLKTEKVFNIHVEKNGEGIPKTSIDGDVEEILSIQNFKEGSVGNISISKTVAGSGGDVEKEFEFTIQLKDGAGNVLPDPYTFLKLDKDKKLLEKGTLTSGQTVKLSHTQSMTILDIPKETVYEVNEKDYIADGYITTVSGDTKGEVVADTVKAIYFTNTRSTGELELAKSVEGIGADKTRKFKFTVDFDGKDADAHFQYKGNGVPDGQIKKGDKIELAHGQSIVIEGILEGTTYKVQEQDYTSEGYTVTVSGEKGNISADKVSKVHFVNTKMAEIKPESGHDNSHTKNVPNAQLGVKVQTGDNTSVLPYFALCILAGVGIVTVVYIKLRKNKSQK